MSSIKPNLVFPKPKRTMPDKGTLVISELGMSECRICTNGQTSILIAESAGLLAEKIEGRTGVRPDIREDYTEGFTFINFHIGHGVENVNSNEEGYRIEIDEKGVRICASSGKGIFNGVQTLVQLFEMQGGKLVVPCCKIEDWPDMKHRGLFIEDRYGPDMMTLEDWKDTVDYMASLKMNFLGVGIYGCWSIQYDNRISEYWYIPIKKYPELRTERTIRYYSPQEGVWKTIKFVPDMFKDDFFGELIAYGKKKNVIVRPHFNSMGHNTLIPRLFPETSARDEKGNSTGYSFCTSTKKTYEILFDIYDEIIDRYLAPNGIDWFHMGLDEVWDSRGIDPEDPLKVFSPWCQCGECSKHSKEDIFIEHTIKLAKHLKEKGINNITMWHDELLKMDLLNEKLVKRLKEEGLYENIILNWWRYGTEVFETTKPELGIRRFVSPMTGYYHWMTTGSYLTNIYKMLELGHREGAEGAESYCTFDVSYDRNLKCFSEYTWNKTDVGNLDYFREKYVTKHFAGDYDKAKKALEYFEGLAEPGEKRTMLGRTLVYYMYTYVREGKEYPRNFPGEIFTTLYENDKNIELLREIVEESTKAYELFDELARKMVYDNRLLEHYKVECMNFKVLAKEFLSLIEVVDRNKEAVETGKDKASALKAVLEIKEVVSGLIRDRKSLMFLLEKTKSAYLIPSEMRNASIHMQYLADVEIYLGRIAGDIREGREVAYPLLNLKDTRPVENEMFKLLRYKSE